MTYKQWLDECLKQYQKEWWNHPQYGGRKYHQLSPEADDESAEDRDLIIFHNDGTAWVYGAFGTASLSGFPTLPMGNEKDTSLRKKITAVFFCAEKDVPSFVESLDAFFFNHTIMLSRPGEWIIEDSNGILSNN